MKSIGSILLKIMLLISIAEMAGIKTTSIIAVLGAACLAVGLAIRENRTRQCRYYYSIPTNGCSHAKTEIAPSI